MSMKRYLIPTLAVIAGLATSIVAAQSISPGTPSAGTGSSTSGQTLYNTGSGVGGFTLSGDCTLVASTGVITCLDTNGTAFGNLATLGTISAGNVIANSTGSTANAVSTTLTALIDQALGNTQGDVLYRGASGWAVLAPGTSGQALETGGASANPSWQTVSGGSGCTVSGTTGGVVFYNGTNCTVSSKAILTTPASGVAGLTLSDTLSTGNGTTNTLPYIYINQGTGPTTWSNAGTELGVNAPSGFTGNFMDFHLNGGSSLMSMTYQGVLNLSGQVNAGGNITGVNMNAGATAIIDWTGRGVFSSPGAGQIQLGAAQAASPVNQTLLTQGSRGGTDTNVAGGNLTMQSGLGTGNATGSTFTLSTPHAGSTGATAQTPNAQITLGDNTVTINQITTGTNADFVCASSGLVLLIQSSACTISSKRFKDIVGLMDAQDALNDVLALKPTVFTMKQPATPKERNRDPNYYHRQLGLIAEDVAKVDPKLAVYESDMKTPKSYRQEAVIAALVGAVKAQQAEITELRKWPVAVPSEPTPLEDVLIGWLLGLTGLQLRSYLRRK